MSVSDPVVVFERARIRQVANPLDISRRPEIPSLAGFIGESSLIAAAVIESATSKLAPSTASHADMSTVWDEWVADIAPPARAASVAR